MWSWPRPSSRFTLNPLAFRAISRSICWLARNAPPGRDQEAVEIGAHRSSIRRAGRSVIVTPDGRTVTRLLRENWSFTDGGRSNRDLVRRCAMGGSAVYGEARHHERS